MLITAVAQELDALSAIGVQLLLPHMLTDMYPEAGKASARVKLFIFFEQLIATAAAEVYARCILCIRLPAVFLALHSSYKTAHFGVLLVKYLGWYSS